MPDSKKEKVKLRNINAKNEDEAVKEFDRKHGEDLLKYQVERNLPIDWIPAEGYKFEDGTISAENSGAAEKPSGKGSNK